jgi:hypothetical protein
MYAVRDKATKEIIFENSDPLPKGLKGKDVYPIFDAKKMELLTYDGDQLPQHYKVRKGVVYEKSSKEKLKDGLIRFDKNLFSHVEFDGESNDPPNMQLVKAGLKHKLIKTIADCELAFLLLDEEFEFRVAEKFRPGYEMKIMKDYTDWVGEEKPAGDKRESKYNDMKAAINAIKEEYKEPRKKLKKIIVTLKEKEAK